MKIEITLNNHDYGIYVEGTQFTLVRYSVNETKDSKNYGQRTEVTLGFFSKLSSAANRLCKEELSLSDDLVSLKEFVSRVEAINNYLANQFEAIGI